MQNLLQIDVHSSSKKLKIRLCSGKNPGSDLLTPKRQPGQRLAHNLTVLNSRSTNPTALRLAAE